MFGFVTSIVMGALLASIALKYELEAVLILLVLSTLFAFITHMEDLPNSLRVISWYTGLSLGAVAVGVTLYSLV